MAYEELTIEGRNAVIEAFRAGKTVDKIFVLEGCKDGPIQTVLREAKKQSTVVNFVKNYQRQVSIKELLHIWRLMSIAQ